MARINSQLPVLTFGRASLTGAACFERWRNILSIVFDVEPDHREDVDSFTGSMTTYHLGGLLLSDTAGSAVRFRRSGATIARSAIEHYLVQVYLEGGYAGSVGGREVEMRAGDVCVLDLTRPLSTRADTFRNITIVVPRDSLAPLVKSPDTLHGTILPGASAVGSLLGDHLRTLCDRLPDMTEREARAVAGGTAGLVAACLGSTIDAHEPPRAELHAAMLARIKRFIDERLDSPDLDADTICRTFGLSRSSLYRLFDPLGGVAAHIRERRLSRAFADLVTPQPGRTRVIDIALHRGFGSEASFSRAFRAIYGLTPGEARAIADGMRRLLAPADSGDADSVLQRWMHSLYPARTAGGA
ncbi:helix-turn-helix domain-containing protein [Azospirillum halopraeferens]|uniref:AraC-like ligand-binding domain-containing protein n=1 Tax=Azospirillum halopraeferens TaxID=34010 RepID=UPI00041CC2E3|nr:helix-turn-helix domain-containing protein [Azospirillum halopraeferens]